MDERLFARLAAMLANQHVVLATVIDTRGATPRNGGSRMLISADHTEFSVGGGAAESRVIDAARTLLSRDQDQAELKIDLSGKPGAAGVCGGRMRIALRQWRSADQGRAMVIAGQLASGNSVSLQASDVGIDHAEIARPDPRLLIVGAGHCAAALCDLAHFLDFELWVHDSRSQCLQSASFTGVKTMCGSFDLLLHAFDTQREVMVVLLNRDFVSDVATLDAIATTSPCFIGMMGSHKRIKQVRAAALHSPLMDRLHTPIGAPIQAETPHEIAVSILAQLIGFLRTRGGLQADE